MVPNHSIERTSASRLRLLAASAHVKTLGYPIKVKSQPVALVLLGLAPWAALLLLDTGHSQPLFFFAVCLFILSVASGLIGSRTAISPIGRKLFLAQAATNTFVLLFTLGIVIAAKF